MRFTARPSSDGVVQSAPQENHPCSNPRMRNDEAFTKLGFRAQPMNSILRMDNPR
jgi:hypothetical protein